MGIGCRRRSPLLLHPPSRSRSLLHQRGSTPSGSEDPSSLPSPPSNRCGSPSRSMTSPALESSTGSASKLQATKYGAAAFSFLSTAKPNKIRDGALTLLSSIGLVYLFQEQEILLFN